MRTKDFTEYLNMSPAELHELQKSRGWALSFVGVLVYKVLLLFGCKPKDYRGICQYFEIGKSWGGLELGWFFICSKDADEHVKMHEVGHNIQNAAVGGFTMVFLCIGSALRYWVRRIFGATNSYDSWWFEGQATSLGTEYVKKNKA